VHGPDPAAISSQAPAVRPDEHELRRRLLGTLIDHFDVTEEVWLRHPLHCLDLRIDVVAVPRPPLDRRFPFPLLGVEIKTDRDELRHVTHAYKQCLDYKQCVVNDKRLRNLRGLWLPCVALYRGRQTPRWPDETSDPWEAFAVRLAGKFNVGVLEHGYRGALELRVCDERIWSTRSGVSDARTAWPAARLIANSNRRT
jgi:hypothetical protein